MVAGVRLKVVGHWYLSERKLIERDCNSYLKYWDTLSIFLKDVTMYIYIVFNR